MPRFIYKAKKSPTETIDGEIEAETLDRAAEEVIKSGLIPIDVAAKRIEKIPASHDQEQKLAPAFFSIKVKLSDISFFTRQLCDLVDAGVPILRALQVTANQTKNPQLKEIIGEMGVFVQDGGTLSQAMAQYPNVFSQLYVNLVKSGEISGNLDIVLTRLAEFIDKDLEVRSKVKSSLVYPALILIVGFLTIFVLLTFVVPRLTVMFDDLTESLPLPTVILIAVSNFFAKFWWLIIGAGVLSAWYLQRFLQAPEGKLWFDRLKLKIPVVGNFIREAEIGRFARTLSTLLKSGVVIVSALESVWAVLDNEVLKEEVRAAAESVAGGDSLTIALQRSEYFLADALNMIAIGEESGRLEQALSKLADSYERQCDRSIKIVTSLLEPVMIVVIGGVVFFIVMAVILPILKMNQVVR